MKVKYNYYLKVNDFDKNINVIFKYLRRYYNKIFDKKIGDFQTVKRKKSVLKDSPLYDFQKKSIIT